VVTDPGNIFAKIEFDEFEAVGTGPVFGFTLHVFDIFGNHLAVPNFPHVVQFEVWDTIVVKMFHVRIGENLKKTTPAHGNKDRRKRPKMFQKIRSIPALLVPIPLEGLIPKVSLARW
jgi:hypothetical protein